MSQKLSTGRLVQYVLTAADAEAINRRRSDAKNLNAAGVTLASQGLGPQIHVGNEAREGQTFPALVTAIFDGSEDTFNGQAFLDGNDVLWVTSVKLDEFDAANALVGAAPKPGSWHWPARV